MSTVHRVDPDLVATLAMLPPDDLSRDNLAAMRAAVAAMFSAASPSSETEVSVDSIDVPGPAGAPPVRVLRYTPLGDVGLRPALLHIHGGGYVLGQPEMADQENLRLATTLQCVIISVDYRLAPEAPFPAPVEDCYAALVWLHANAAELGVDPARIGVKGESAGGGLAAATALLARDRNGPPLAFQHLIYPMVDDRTCVDDDPHPFVGEFGWTRASNAFGWSALLDNRPGSVDISPYAAPARTEKLSGLPATFIAVGDLDLFLEENLEFARRLSRAGVPIELHVYPGAFHGFHMAADAHVSREAQRHSNQALERAMMPRNANVR